MYRSSARVRGPEFNIDRRSLGGDEDLEWVEAFERGLVRSTGREKIGQLDEAPAFKPEIGEVNDRLASCGDLTEADHGGKK